MPKINTNNKEESLSEMEITVNEAMKRMIPFPFMICGVNRKINIGDYENIDVFSGIGIPIIALPHEDLDAFKEAAVDAAELGFAITSGETATRYTAVKDSQKRS